MTRRSLKRLAVLPLLGLAALLVSQGCGSVLSGNHAPMIRSLTANGFSIPDSAEPDTELGANPHKGPLGSDANALKVNSGQVVTFLCAAHDQDRDPVTYHWTGDSVTAPAATADQTMLSWTVPSTEGVMHVACTVEDDRGGSATQTVALQVTNPALNHPPVATLSLDKSAVAAKGTVQATCMATDPDKDPLMYAFSAQKGTILQSATAPSTATYTAPDLKTTDPAISDTISCFVTDGKGAFVRADAMVAITPGP
jgi:hypothetical protein